MSPFSIFEFDRAIVRSPGRSVVDGVRAGDGDGPSYEGVLFEHKQYVAALERAGVDVTTLEPLEAFPDSVFVEDPALVFSEAAILLRPGTPSRAPEAATLASALGAKFDQVLQVDDGAVEGGDIMVTPTAVIIGLSDRTDRDGAHALEGKLAAIGRAAIIAETPRGTLHFKTASSMVDDETVLVTPALAHAEVFAGFRKLVVDERELGGANVLRINDVVFVGSCFPRTIDVLARHGARVETLPVEEIGKIDAGLTCMSLRWKSAR